MYISTGLFTWNKEDKTFTGELSDLPSSPFNRIYDDACDAGFYLVSHKTGMEIRFVLDAERRDEEGETTHWIFKPDERQADVKRYGLSNIRVYIFND